MMPARLGVHEKDVETLTSQKKSGVRRSLLGRKQSKFNHGLCTCIAPMPRGRIPHFSRRSLSCRGFENTVERVASIERELGIYFLCLYNCQRRAVHKLAF